MKFEDAGGHSIASWTNYYIVRLVFYIITPRLSAFSFGRMFSLVLLGGFDDPAQVFPSGELRWSLLKSTPLRDHDDDGELIGAITVIEDVTAVKTAEVRTRVLAESGRILASSLDYEQTLRNVADIAVPALADYCGVDLLDDHGVLERVAASHRDPQGRQFARRLMDIPRVLPDSGHPTRRVLLTGTTELYAEVGDAQLEVFTRDAVHGQLLRELGVRSADARADAGFPHERSAC